MGLTKFTIYKYVKTARGWRYCRTAYSASRKIKPDVVIVDGKEELHTEGGVLSERKRLAGQGWEHGLGGARIPEEAGGRTQTSVISLKNRQRHGIGGI
jgi:hypothetical protein